MQNTSKSNQPSPGDSFEPQILFENEWFFAINKPCGWVVHRGLARDRVTVVDVVKQTLDTDKVFPVHRLDRQTSGVLLFAKDALFASELQQLLIDGAIQKEYLALVRGTTSPHGVIDSPVPKKEKGERVSACTSYRQVAAARTLPRETSLVLAYPKTGRFHQIRRHLKHINHPIIGDANYGKGALNRAFAEAYQLQRMALHALSLRIPLTDGKNPLVIHAPLPPDLVTPLQRMGYSLGE